MTESQQQPGENPTNEELDVEGPNESAQPSGGLEGDETPPTSDDEPPPGANS